MRIGMLWLDTDPKTVLAEKVIKAVTYYAEKYGRVPNICLVHPSMLPDKPLELAAITVQARRYILPHHFWIGIEEKG